jgi:hypothetical protein
MDAGGWSRVGGSSGSMDAGGGSRIGCSSGSMDAGGWSRIGCSSGSMMRAAASKCSHLVGVEEALRPKRPHLGAARARTHRGARTHKWTRRQGDSEHVAVPSPHTQECSRPACHADTAATSHYKQFTVNGGHKWRLPLQGGVRECRGAGGELSPCARLPLARRRHVVSQPCDLWQQHTASTRSVDALTCKLP